MCKNDRKLKGTRIFLAHHGVCLFIKYARVNIIGLHVGKAKSVTLLMTVAFFLYYLFPFDEKETKK